MHIHRSISLVPLGLALLLNSIGCRSLQPIDLPDETAVAPVSIPLWSAVNKQREGNWFHLLNEGESALEWRLRAMESATASLDLQAFLWKEDRIGLLLFRQILETADRGMHNKVMVADNRSAIVGGRNLANEYFGHHEAGNFRDMEVLCTGPIVQELSRCFDSYWNSNWSLPVDRIFSRPSSKRDLDRLRA